MHVDFRSTERVKFQYVNGPWHGIEQLTCTWKLSEVSPDGCDIKVNVEFHLSSFVLSSLSYLFFGYVVKSVIAAFQQRAHALFGPSAPTLNVQPRRRKRPMK
jgi:coenzyme Q-binding protein COQ10